MKRNLLAVLMGGLLVVSTAGAVVADSTGYEGQPGNQSSGGGSTGGGNTGYEGQPGNQAGNQGNQGPSGCPGEANPGCSGPGNS